MTNIATSIYTNTMYNTASIAGGTTAESLFKLKTTLYNFCKSVNVVTDEPSQCNYSNFSWYNDNSVAIDQCTKDIKAIAAKMHILIENPSDEILMKHDALHEAYEYYKSMLILIFG